MVSWFWSWSMAILVFKTNLRAQHKGAMTNMPLANFTFAESPFCLYHQATVKSLNHPTPGLRGKEERKMKVRKIRESLQCPECGYWSLREGNRKGILFTQNYIRMLRCPCGYKTEMSDEQIKRYDETG